MIVRADMSKNLLLNDSYSMPTHNYMHTMPAIRFSLLGSATTFYIYNAFILSAL